MQLNEDYYTVEFKVQLVNNERVVIHSDCQCVSGEGWPDCVGADCKHAAALYFFINSGEHKSISKTDEKLAWKTPSEKKRELYPQGKTFAELIKNSRGFKRNYLIKDNVAINKIRGLMEKHYTEDLNERGLYKISRPIDPNAAQPQPPQLPEINPLIESMLLKPLPYEIPADILMAIDDLQNFPEVFKYFMENVAIDSNGSVSIFKKTPKQALSADWIKERDPRLNSSTANDIAKVTIHSKVESSSSNVTFKQFEIVIRIEFI